MNRNKLITLGIVVFSFLCGVGAQYRINQHNYNKSYKLGFQDGGEDGWHYAFDTILKIMNNQVGNDSIVSEVHLVEKDTITFWLSAK